MSKTIEFVNEKIKETEKTQRMLETVYHSPRDKVSERKLKILQQIKCELEAWEVVKKYCDYQDNDRFNCLLGAFYLIEPIKGLDFVILKKALEAEDEKED